MEFTISRRKVGALSLGMNVGCDLTEKRAKGQFEELETFNYPLTAQEIARDFPNFVERLGT